MMSTPFGSATEPTRDNAGRMGERAQALTRYALTTHGGRRVHLRAPAGGDLGTVGATRCHGDRCPDDRSGSMSYTDCRHFPRLGGRMSPYAGCRCGLDSAQSRERDPPCRIAAPGAGRWRTTPPGSSSSPCPSWSSICCGVSRARSPNCSTSPRCATSPASGSRTAAVAAAMPFGVSTTWTGRKGRWS